MLQSFLVHYNFMFVLIQWVLWLEQVLWSSFFHIGKPREGKTSKHSFDLNSYVKSLRQGWARIEILLLKGYISINEKIIQLKLGNKFIQLNRNWVPKKTTSYNSRNPSDSLHCPKHRTSLLKKKKKDFVQLKTMLITGPADTHRKSIDLEAPFFFITSRCDNRGLLFFWIFNKSRGCFLPPKRRI